MLDLLAQVQGVKEGRTEVVVDVVATDVVVAVEVVLVLARVVEELLAHMPGPTQGAASTTGRTP